MIKSTNEIVFDTIVDYELDMLKRMTFLNTRILIVTKNLDTLNYSKFRKNFQKNFLGVNFFLGSYLRVLLLKGGAKLYNLGYPVGLIEMCGSVEMRALSRVYGK